MKLKIQAFSTIFSIGLLAASAPAMAAANKTHAPADTDRIEVIAHYPLSGPPITRVSADSHWENRYLYLERATGPATILDVTNPRDPKAAGQIDLPAQSANENINTVVGTAALLTSAPQAQPTQPETVTVLTFGDPEHPKVAHQFSGVTAMYKDESRGLIYLANPDGLWVLHLQPARDVAAEKAYLDHVLYNP
jgi:hypothetical protein